MHRTITKRWTFALSNIGVASLLIAASPILVLRITANRLPLTAYHLLGTAHYSSLPADSDDDEKSNRSQFQPLRRPAVPDVTGDDWSNNAIDRFILDKLQQHAIRPNPRATRRELIRRAFFDLIGLPPTPEEVESFDNDESPQAFERVIDSLLSRPAYGERWARHWLDVVRYAETNGYERDGEKPNAWRYRDYVIRAFNEDKPYDQFVLEQLAGDELDPVTDDGIIATGFYRLGVWDDEPDDARMAEFESLDDIMVATGATFLGLTVGCARCHDHKFDPIPQSDYYKLLAFFRNIRPYTNPTPTYDSSTFVPLGDRATVAERLQAAGERSKALREELAKTEDTKEKKRLQDEITKIEAESIAGLEWALAVRDGELKPTHVLVRGNAGSPGAEVQPGFLSWLSGGASEPPIQGDSSLRRLTLARWIASPNHPLTARVLANRVWQHHFGRAIVKSTSDFGHSGFAPTHPELLDWLATELIAGGWSIKHLHRVIMLSQTYQMSSRVADDLATRSAATPHQPEASARANTGHQPEASARATGPQREASSTAAEEVDPANDLFWRQNLRRLEAESLRDAILAVSGDLDETPNGRGFFPHTAGEVLAAGSRPGDGWATSPPNERLRRSIYAFVKRSMVPPFFEGFDYTNTATPLGERPVTTVAPQALMLLNDHFVREQAASLASRIEREVGTDRSRQIDRAYSLALGRTPTSSERQIAERYLDRQSNSFAAIESRLTFAPDVPISLHRGYMSRLQPTDFLIGPRDGWTYHRGRWGRDYEGITTLDRTCTPFALWQGTTFNDAVITAEITLSKGVETGSVLLRAVADSDVLQGYEALFDAREQTVSLRRHMKETATLAQTKCRVPTVEPCQIRIEIAGPQIQLWFDGSFRSRPNGQTPADIRLTANHSSIQPILKVTDPEPILTPGRIGVSAWGAALSLDHLAIEHEGSRYEAAPKPLDGQARTRALESLCLLIFNLNEFIYVD